MSDDVVTRVLSAPNAHDLEAFVIRREQLLG